ncbi:FkbM family methyltransferase [Cupriavidus sp. 30B13]|uniref:FkbM family methyltransferase n=1 Tax=Cupriavidus sp. 30B13 TaxID=3384241 RepID=UPI003B902ECD
MKNKQFKELIGPQGRLISLFRTVRAVPFSLDLPVFGTVSTLDEVLNIHDNFAKGELRHPDIEDHLSHSAQPVVVDCGVNIGVTIRWWHFLNRKVRVFGFDMMSEAHAFTQDRIGTSGSWYEPITCALSASEGDNLEISFDDPLFGENSVSATGRRQKRTIETGTLDARLEKYELAQIDLLKIDIEGHGAEALKGGSHTLRRTRYVLFETHTRQEISDASILLHDAGFRLIAMRNRTLVYARDTGTSPIQE